MSMSQRSIAVSTTKRPYDSTPFRSHARSYEAAIKEPKAAYDKVSGKLADDFHAAVRKAQADYGPAASKADVPYVAALRKWQDTYKP